MPQKVLCFVCGDLVDADKAERFVLETGQASAKNLQQAQEFAHRSCEPRVNLNTVRVVDDTVVIRV